MLITSPRKKVDVQVSACDIEKKSQIKYLGVFIDDIFKLKIGSLVHKLQYNKQETPPALHGLVSLASDVHKHNTRFATSQNFNTDHILELIMD